ncbi:lantibiotic dehydratase [Protofrankia symbiont of Coriaria ruscifolia]|uniref:lantibiotic dehydratase n=1 Tax=Protofrankia symbiont of Coriaria ruscifolia TaxID=1306542 RepID=UPI0013EF751F|nr:lantibiotic dehydratase [Protofrankia symbiont of Coriaria ruscifolia]
MGGALYRPAGPALLRAAMNASGSVACWPVLEDPAACREWLAQVWAAAREPVALASSALAAQVEQIVAGQPVTDRRLRAATATVVRYLLRAEGRATPFALFAGVAPAMFGQVGSVRFGDGHRSVARVDAAWLGEVIERLETGPLLERVTVVLSSLVVERAGRLIVPHPDGQAEVPITPPVRLARDAAGDPVCFAELANRLNEAFTAAGPERIKRLLRQLVAEHFLVTDLRAPMTETDPLGHLITVLRAVGACELAEVAPLVEELTTIHTRLGELNATPTLETQAAPRTSLLAAMDRIAPQQRSPLALDLVLDCDLQLPESVASDLAVAAGVLTRLGREPLGPAAWADYHRRFVERYGVGSVVPLLDVLDGASGLGYPAGYPGSVLPAPAPTVTDRDRRLLALAWEALAGGGPLELTDALIEHVTAGDLFDSRFVPAHGEIAAKVCSRSVEALNAGDYHLAGTPARAAGTLTARFQPSTGDTALARVYRSVPVLHEGATAVQLACPSRFVRGQNVARLPQFLPEVLALGEPPPDGPRGMGPADLALTATGRGLLLIEAATRRIVDPQIFHALALDRQLPPLARFLAHVPRAFAASLTAFEFGPAAGALPHLPEVRYGRIILAPERWRLHTADLPGLHAPSADWSRELGRWRHRHRCPDLVELADGDMTLRLDLTVPVHGTILREQLADAGVAMLNRAVPGEDLAWIGHAHEVVVPVVRAGPPTPNKLALPLVSRVNTDGHRPADPNARWISGRVHTHPAAMDDLIAAHLPDLGARLDGAPLWMVRYRNTEQTDHLRIRVAAEANNHADRVAVLGAWAATLATTGIAGPVSFDTYFPEAGRYGADAALEAAEAVFCADTTAAITALRQPPARLHPDTVVALSMLDIADAFLGGMRPAVDYLTTRVLAKPQTIDHRIVGDTTRVGRHSVPRDLPHLPAALADAWAARAKVLATYRAALPSQMEPARVADSLLHLSYNRLRGINRDHEAACLRLARGAALAWRTTQKTELA